MKILGIDTTTDVCSVAIFNYDRLLASKTSERDFSHASLLNSFIEECLGVAQLKLNDLSAISIASGPGSYTGLRVGASTAKGLCFGLDIPLIAIDALTSLAHSVSATYLSDDKVLIMPMIDARREEVYTVTYDRYFNQLSPIKKTIVDQAYFEEYSDRNLLLCGNGYEKFIGKFDLSQCIFLDKDADAANLWRPSIHAFEQQLFEKLDVFSPFYLAEANITATKKNIFL